MFTQSDTKNSITALFPHLKPTELSAISTWIKNSNFYNKFSSKPILPHQSVLSPELSKMQVDTKKYMKMGDYRAVQNNNHLPQLRREAAIAQNSLHIFFNKGFDVFM